LWVDPVAYLKGIDTLPHPPIYYSEDEASVTSSRRGALFLTWSMLLAALDGFVESGRILCPVRTHMGPVAKVVNFRDPDAEEKTTTCEQFVNDKCCGTFDGTFEKRQPQTCPFAGVVRVFIEGSVLNLFGGRNKPPPTRRK